MKKLVVVLVMVALAGSTAALAQEWKNAALVDHMCLDKVKDDPDAHPASCLIQCAKSGYGILAADGTWLQFDKGGNEKALAALKATSKKDHIRVNVTGELSGTKLTVASLAITE